MKIIFLGSSAFAVPILKRVLESQFEVTAVVTKADAIAGRGLTEKGTAVKEFTTANFPQIPLLQPESLKDEAFLESLQGFGADIFLVASFPIMPKKMLAIPPLGAMNVHPSLLPKYRGAAPIRWTLFKGEIETGVTTFFIGGKVDAGNIFLQRRIHIHPYEDYGALHDRLAALGAEMAVESLEKIAQGDISTTIQDESLACPAPKISKEDCLVDWSKSSLDICNQIRALSPEPGAYTVINGKRLKLFAANPTDKISARGDVLIDKDKVFIGCGGGCLELVEVQIEGKKRMKIGDFLRGVKWDRCSID